MKKIVLILLFVILLSSCKEKMPEEATSASTEAPVTETLPLDVFDTEFTEPEETTPSASIQIEEVTLAVLDYGSYNGVYVEDGSDEKVEGVACMLVRNTTEKYLDYGVVTATINGQETNFAVTGLPGGAAAWVLEQNRSPLEQGEEFIYGDQTVSELRDDIVPEDDRVEVELLNGNIRIKNVSQNSLSSVRVYYKQVHTDDNFLGGITYTTKAEGLEPGQSIEVPAGHSREEHCRIVRIDCTE